MPPRVESSYVELLCGVEAGLPLPVPAGLIFGLLLLRLPLAAVSAAVRRMLPRRAVRTAAAARVGLSRGVGRPGLRLESALPQFADQVRQVGAESVGHIAIRGMYRDSNLPGALRHADVDAAPAIVQMQGDVAGR